jgi:hypothetical protein
MAWLDWISPEWEELVEESVRASTLRELERVRRRNGERYAYLLEVIAHSDPIRIGDISPNEYVPEVDRIFARLHSAHDEEGLQRLMHEVFVAMFDPVTVGPLTHYQQPGHDYWVWQQTRGQS